jgi:hypothetical protein
VGLEKKAGSRIRLKAEREQPLSGSRSIQPVGNTLTARYRMTDEVDLVAASRWENFGPFDRALHSLGMETRISDDTFAYSRYVLRRLLEWQVDAGRLRSA